MNGGLHSIWEGLQSAFSALSDQPVFGAAAIFLGLIFAISAVPKLRRPELAAMAIVDFGVAQRVHRSAGLTLGAGELTLAVALAAAAGTASQLRFVPMALAAILLWTFVFLIGRALRSAEHFSCFCFGDTEDSISVSTLARSCALALLATAMAALALSDVAAPDLQAWALEFVVAASILGTGSLVVGTRALGEAR